MALKRGDEVPDDCGPPSLVGNLIMQPLKDGGGDTLETEQTGLARGRVINVGGTQPVQDHAICTGVQPMDPYNPFFSFAAKGKVFRCYLKKGGSDCTEPAVMGGNLSSGSWKEEDIAVITNANINMSNIWKDPVFKGEEWRIIATPNDTYTGHGIIHSGTIDNDGNPVGLQVEQVTIFGNPNWWKMSYLAPGPTVLFSSSPPPPLVSYTFHYILEYSCNGEWWSDEFYGSSP